MNGTHLNFTQLAEEFEKKLHVHRSAHSDIAWYPYPIMMNAQHIEHLLPASILDALASGNLDMRVLDIGAADGDLGFFFESRGASVDFLDNATTNYNDCKALHAYRDSLGSNAGIMLQDIDAAYELQGQYDIALALGLLYHLRNPFLFLMTLVRHAERMILSTRVCHQLPDGTHIEQVSAAYLLGCRESNNDSTNYWILTPKGLLTVLKRSGWDVKNAKVLGSSDSNPVDQHKDARMFVYCERIQNWRDIGKHHDF